MTHNETTTAHTATAGDGWLHSALDEIDQILWEENCTTAHPAYQALERARVAAAALAQASAVQAPAGEDAGLPAIGAGASAAQQEAYRRKHFPHATPTDAKPKAARPVGGDVRWGVEDTGDNLWVGPMRPDGGKVDHIVYGQDLRGYRAEYAARVRAEAHLIADSVNAALSSHPTTGQETVATLRDGGVREAPQVQEFEVTGDDGYIIHFAGSQWFCFQHEVSAYKSWATSEIARLRAALSAPGSVGPGEPTDAMLEAFYRAAWPAAWDANGHIPDHKIADLRKGWAAAVALTTHATVETNTGNTGDRGSEAVAAIAFAQTIDDHYDMREFLRGWSEGDVSEWPEFFENLATTATKAETPGPAMEG